MAHQSIKGYLSALRNLHITAGFHEEELTPKLEVVLRSIKKQAAKNRPPHVRLPITIEVMAKIKEVLQKDSTNEVNLLFWAACALAFFGFLRCGEFTAPSQLEYDPSTHLSGRLMNG